MLDSFLNKKSEKGGGIEGHLQKGLEYVEGKFYKKALMEFRKAMDADRETVYPRLVEELDSFARGGNFEGALAVGLNLLNDNPKDYELANNLGNYARELQDYKQANNLYKHALKIKKNFQEALFNLAASMARVDKYDDQAVSAYRNFDGTADYILPDYLGGPDILEQLMTEVQIRKATHVEEKSQEIYLQIEAKTLEGDTDAADDLQEQLDQLNAGKDTLEPQDILDGLEEKASKDPANASAHYYNAAVYALSEQDAEAANESLDKCIAAKGKYEYIGLLRAIYYAKTGDLEKGINTLIKLLGTSRYNRYFNANLGLMYRKKKNVLLSAKYLILASSLLERSNGLYSIYDLLKIANEKFEKNQLKDALKLFRVIADETQSPETWLKIGAIYYQQNKYMEAVKSFKQVLTISPSNEDAAEKLREIHDFFADKGEGLFQEMKMKPAADNFEKALSVIRDPETIQKAIQAYKQLKRADKEKALSEELLDIREAEKLKTVEAERQENIRTAAGYLKAKNYFKAVEYLERAFRMKLDRDIFLQLAGLYKGLKKHGELQDLLNRWNKMVEHEEKMKKYEKSKERAKTGEED